MLEFKLNGGEGVRQGKIGANSDGSLDIEQGGVNSGPDSCGVPEWMRTDGPGFSLCAAPLESSGPEFQSGVVGWTNEQRSRGIPDRRWWIGLTARGGVRTDNINGT